MKLILRIFEKFILKVLKRKVNDNLTDFFPFGKEKNGKKWKSFP